MKPGYRYPKCTVCNGRFLLEADDPPREKCMMCDGEGWGIVGDPFEVEGTDAEEEV